MKCQNCGHDNDIDATFCEKCGSPLERRSHYRRPPRDVEKTGMSTNTKVGIIIAIIALVAILGVVAGAWMIKSSPPSTQLSFNESSEKVTYQAGWHQVTSFSGVSDDYRSFQIQGQRFKIVMSATPTLNYNTNFMNVDVSGSSGLIGSGDLNWDQLML